MGAKTCKGMLCMLYSCGLVVARVAGDYSLAARRVARTWSLNTLNSAVIQPEYRLNTAVIET